MEPPRNRGTITFILVVGAAIIWIFYQLNGPSFFTIVGPAVTIVPNAQGTIVSIETSASGKEAIVQLADGEKVRANIPPACVVFPGQVADLLFADGSIWGKHRYTILSAKEPQ